MPLRVYSLRFSVTYLYVSHLITTLNVTGRAPALPGSEDCPTRIDCFTRAPACQLLHFSSLIIMQLGALLKLKLRRVLRRGKPKGKVSPIQNAPQINAEEVDAIGRAVGGPQPALHLPNGDNLGLSRLLDLPVELLLQILEILWEPGPFYSSEHPYSLASLRLLVHSLPYSHPYTHLTTQDMQRFVQPRHSSNL